MDYASYWQEFLRAKNLDSNLKYTSVFHFELTEKWANILLDLVLKGIKKATASSLYSFEIEKEALPKVGDYHIITDWDRNPRAIIQVTKVRIIRYCDMTFEVCKLEGEDESLESWQKGHEKFFRAEGKSLGYTFTEELPILFEEFVCVYPNIDGVEKGA